MRKMTEWNICEEKKKKQKTKKKKKEIRGTFFQLDSVVAVHGGPFKPPFPLSLEAAGFVKIKASFQHEGTAALSH